ncbi:MAG: concanavalin A-like lectin/glucanase [Siphoviridae sp. ctjeG17]|nr:MAG: concanavalin A-like lectin/glucanase [Siphoviridae sp. ctjeG17]
MRQWQLIFLFLFLLSSSAIAQYNWQSNPFPASFYLDLNFSAGESYVKERINNLNFTTGNPANFITSGKYGNAYNFADTYSMHNVSSYDYMSGVAGKTAKTVCFWMNVSSYAGCSDGTPCSLFEAALDGTHFFQISLRGNGILRADISNETTNNYGHWTASNALTATNDWIHLCMRKNRAVGEGMLITINGSINWTGSWTDDAGAGRNTGEHATMNRILYGSHYTGTQPFAGAMDEMIMIDRFLTDAEVADMYNDSFNSAPVMLINSPADNTFSSLSLVVNTTISDAQAHTAANISLYINNTLNTTIYNVTNGTTVLINASMSDGTYRWYLYACDNQTTAQCQNDSTLSRLYTKDSTVPTVIWTNPINTSVISVLNLSENFTASASGSNILSVNFSVYYPNNTRFYNFFSGILNATTYTLSNITVNFTEEFNYTVEAKVTNLANTNISNNRTYYFDNSAPNMTILAPTGAQASLNVTLTTNINDSSPLSCSYNITDSNLNQEVANTSFNCASASFSVSADGSYIAFVTATDTKGITIKNSSFTVSTSSGGGGGSSGGGGGSFTPSASKRACDVIIKPTKVDVGGAYQLAEIKITNNENQSYDPKYIFTPMSSQRDVKNNLFITNDPGLVLKGATVSFGVYFNDSNDNVAGGNWLILENPECFDINVSIMVNQRTTFFTPEFLPEFVDANKSPLENFVDFMKGSFFETGPLNFVQTYMVFILMITLSLYFTVDSIARDYRRGNNFKLVGSFLFFSILIPFIITVILRLIVLNI